MFAQSWMFPEFPILIWLQGYGYCCQKSPGKYAGDLGNIQTSKTFKESENLLFFLKNVNCQRGCLISLASKSVSDVCQAYFKKKKRCEEEYSSSYSPVCKNK